MITIKLYTIKPIHNRFSKTALSLLQQNDFPFLYLFSVICCFFIFIVAGGEKQMERRMAAGDMRRRGRMNDCERELQVMPQGSASLSCWYGRNDSLTVSWWSESLAERTLSKHVLKHSTGLTLSATILTIQFYNRRHGWDGLVWINRWIHF